MKAFARTVREVEQHDVVNSVIFVDKLDAKGPWEWTKHALKALEEATEWYMVEVIAESCF